MLFRILNWWSSRDNKLIYLKAARDDNERIFLTTPLFNYYDSEEEPQNSDVDSTLLFKDSFNIVKPNIFRTKVVQKIDIPEINKNLYFYKSRKKIDKQYLNGFLNYNWYFIFNNIDPSGIYEINEGKLNNLGNNIWGYDNELKNILEKHSNFDSSLNIISFDIECFINEGFPSPYSQPISHICFHIIYKGKELTVILINIDILDIPKDLDDSKFTFLKNKDSFSLGRHNKYILCSERKLLDITVFLLTYRDFDFYLSYNGHVFDLPYIRTRYFIVNEKTITTTCPFTAEKEPIKIQLNKNSFNETFFTEIITNNGSIFFDLYNYAKKTLTSSSYSLNEISKQQFTFPCRVHFKGISFYVTVYKDILKDRFEVYKDIIKYAKFCEISNEIIQIHDKEICENIIILRCSELKIPIDEETGYNISFGKDNIDLVYEYKNYNFERSINMADYCLNDAYLCKMLFESLSIEAKLFASSSSYLLPQSTVLNYRSSTMIKGPLLKLMLDERKILINNGAAHTDYLGAKVFNPSKCIVSNNTIVLDYGSLYPNTCIFANLSPESNVLIVECDTVIDYQIKKEKLMELYKFPDFIVVDCINASSKLYKEIYVYDRRKKAIIPTMLTSLINTRKEFKKKLKLSKTNLDISFNDSMQYVTKILANSIYGLMGYKQNLIYSLASVRCCTSIGVKMITYIYNVLNNALIKDGYLFLSEIPKNEFSGKILSEKVIFLDGLNPEISVLLEMVYGDTDSIFIELVSISDIQDSREIGKSLEKVINEKILFETFSMEFESVYVDLIFQSKKKYFAIKYGPEKNSIGKKMNKGTSLVRRDICLYHKRLVEKLKEYIIHLHKKKTYNSELLLEKIFQIMLEKMKTEKDPETQDFCLTKTYKENYKDSDNINIKKVYSYNENSVYPIRIGDRFTYLFIVKKTKWLKNITGIMNYMYIIDPKKIEIPDGYRIFYEIYFKRIILDTITIVDTDKNIISFMKENFNVSIS